MSRATEPRLRVDPELAVAVGAFVAMEPVAYAAHRWVMHGPGWGWHRSHHERHAVAGRPDDPAGAEAEPPGDLEQFEGLERSGGLEANDWFPIVFAGFTVAVMAAGASRSQTRALLAAGAGVTAYGAAYLFVHDVYIHARLGRLPILPGVERLRAAHARHHRTGGEPYGMLLPIVRERRGGEVTRTTTAALRHAGTRARREKTS